MLFSCVFLAFNEGGVVVGREILTNINEEVFKIKFSQFKKTNMMYRSVFLTEQDLDSFNQQIQNAKTKSPF